MKYLLLVLLLWINATLIWRTANLREQITDLRSCVDSLQVALDKQPDTIFVERVVEIPRQVQKKHVKYDSAQTASIEHVLFVELLKDEVDSSMARIIVAIAKHESGNFNSGLTRRSNNLFGMTWPQLRPSTATGHIIAIDHGNVRRFCTYSSLSSSVNDMVLYLKHWGYPLNLNTPEEMVHVMKKKGYFEASEKSYLRGVKKHLSTLTI